MFDLDDFHDKLVDFFNDKDFITYGEVFAAYGMDINGPLQDTALLHRYLYGDEDKYLKWLESEINKKKQEYDAYDIIQRLIYTKITFCDMEKELDYIPFWKKIYFDLTSKYGDCYDELTALNNLYTEFNQQS